MADFGSSIGRVAQVSGSAENSLQRRHTYCRVCIGDGDQSCLVATEEANAHALGARHMRVSHVSARYRWALRANKSMASTPSTG